jgi:hypothetical protein
MREVLNRHQTIVLVCKQSARGGHSREGEVGEGDRQPMIFANSVRDRINSVVLHRFGWHEQSDMWFEKLPHVRLSRSSYVLILIMCRR